MGRSLLWQSLSVHPWSDTAHCHPGGAPFFVFPVEQKCCLRHISAYQVALCLSVCLLLVWAKLAGIFRLEGRKVVDNLVRGL
jgi:hypothetical protein